jgi:hypothetical protein
LEYEVNDGDGGGEMTAAEVQHALTYSQHSPFYIRSHLVVPNVYMNKIYKRFNAEPLPPRLDERELKTNLGI